MKTVTVPFDLEMARKIQNGEVEGKIMDNYKTEYEIVKYDAKGNYPMIGVYFNEEYNTSHARSFTHDGKYLDHDSSFDLQLELPWYLTYGEGQYVTIETKGHTYVLIYKSYSKGEENPVNYHVLFNTNYKELYFNSYCGDQTLIEEIRPSTPSEIELMHNLLQENGKRWNPDTKRVEDVKKEPEHEFKPLDLILVRSNCWELCQYAFVKDGYVHTVGGLAFNEYIPYEGNEHLLGTTNNPEKHED